MRPIDADYVIEKLNEINGTAELDKAFEVIENAPTVEDKPQGEWISVEDRLPEPYEAVLRTVKSFGWNSTKHIHVDIGSICPSDTNVIAWMPLPEPYRAESEDKEL